MLRKQPTGTYHYPQDNNVFLHQYASVLQRNSSV
jgi:hypothetical protein